MKCGIKEQGILRRINSATYHGLVFISRLSYFETLHTNMSKVGSREE
jgi:hypothetical protein